MPEIRCELRPNALLQLWWIAHNTGRCIDEQVSVMLEHHAEAVRRAVPGELHHSHHCRAAVKLYGFPVLEASPASAAARALTVSLTEPETALLGRLAARAHRSPAEALTAALTSYLRTLKAWATSRRSSSPTTAAGRSTRASSPSARRR